MCFPCPSPCSYYYGESGDFSLTKLIIMPDISKCKGTDCPLKESCYRYTAIDSEYRQSYFMKAPYNKEEDKCNHYWTNSDRG